jgi:peptide deformylase
MPVVPVRLYGDPALRQKARPVAAVDDELRRLIADLRDTMHGYKGVGLAANQVGDLRRVCVVDVPLGEEQRVQLALVNPQLRDLTGEDVAEEGCLSIPGVWEDVKRATRMRVTALDEEGRSIDLVAENYVARVIQHEVDHLNGVLFVDRLSPLKRQLLRKPLQALARGELPEGYEDYGRAASEGAP